LQSTPTSLNNLGAAKKGKRQDETTQYGHQDYHGYGGRPVGGPKEGQTHERATRYITTSRKKHRRTSKYARAITREKTEEKQKNFF
jgi:hypothetical protein